MSGARIIQGLKGVQNHRQLRYLGAQTLEVLRQTVITLLIFYKELHLFGFGTLSELKLDFEEATLLRLRHV